MQRPSWRPGRFSALFPVRRRSRHRPGLGGQFLRAEGASALGRAEVRRWASQPPSDRRPASRRGRTGAPAARRPKERRRRGFRSRKPLRPWRSDARTMSRQARQTRAELRLGKARAGHAFEAPRAADLGRGERLAGAPRSSLSAGKERGGRASAREPGAAAARREFDRPSDAVPARRRTGQGAVHGVRLAGRRGRVTDAARRVGPAGRSGR